MDLVWLLEIGSHLRQQFVGPDSDVHGESQSGLDFILQPGCQLYGILPVASERHVDEALIDAELLQDGRVGAAYSYEAFGTLLVPLPIASDYH